MATQTETVSLPLSPVEVPASSASALKAEAPPAEVPTHLATIFQDLINGEHGPLIVYCLATLS